MPCHYEFESYEFSLLHLPLYNFVPVLRVIIRPIQVNVPRPSNAPGAQLPEKLKRRDLSPSSAPLSQVRSNLQGPLSGYRPNVFVPTRDNVLVSARMAELRQARDQENNRKAQIKLREAKTGMSEEARLQMVKEVIAECDARDYAKMEREQAEAQKAAEDKARRAERDKQKKKERLQKWKAKKKLQKKLKEEAKRAAAMKKEEDAKPIVPVYAAEEEESEDDSVSSTESEEVDTDALAAAAEVGEALEGEW